MGITQVDDREYYTVIRSYVIIVVIIKFVIIFCYTDHIVLAFVVCTRFSYSRTVVLLLLVSISGRFLNSLLFPEVSNFNCIVLYLMFYKIHDLSSCW